MKTASQLHKEIIQAKLDWKAKRRELEGQMKELGFDYRYSDHYDVWFLVSDKSGDNWSERVSDLVNLELAFPVLDK